MPAISGLAEQISQWTERRGDSLTNNQKQLFGRFVMALMTANGYEKTGFKRAIGVPGWTRGELYRKQSAGISFHET